MADEDCYELLLDGAPTGIVELPVEWVRDDAVYFMMHRFQSLRPYTPPTDVFDIFRREFDAACEDGGIFQLTMHPHMIGYRSRIWILEELIRHAQGQGRRVVRDPCRGRHLGARPSELKHSAPCSDERSIRRKTAATFGPVGRRDHENRAAECATSDAPVCT